VSPFPSKIDLNPAQSDLLVFDRLTNTDPAVAANEKFFTLRQAGYGEVLRGVSFTPATGSDQ